MTRERPADSVLVSVVRRYEEIPWLDQMRGLIRRWWGIETLYVDSTNSPIFMTGQPHKLDNRVCAICLAGQAGLRRCQESMSQAQRQAERVGRTDGLLSYGCHLGQTVLVVPIFIDQRYGGMIYTTGFFDHPPSREERAELLERGARINPALGNEELFASTPVLGGADLERLEDLLKLGVSVVATLYGQIRASEEQIEQLQRKLERRGGYAGLVGRSEAMREVYSLVERVAANDCTVLVRGESGTGKELVAQAIHRQSHRAEGPFVVQNCSAFNDNLLESELFGHVRGAFTGAVSDKKGLFEIASGGSLFLDEVAEMSPALQAKLLRVLQDQTFWPVGATTPRSSDVRILAATHRDLEAMVREESFREDLYYRLNVITINLPPLRERRGDIKPLVAHFLGRHGGGAIDPDALRVLTDYDWPGNVRELANEIERMTVLSTGDGPLAPELISSRIRDAVRSRQGPAVPAGTLREAIAELERQMIGAALQQCKGNRSHAARQLGIARSNLLVKIKSYRLGTPS